VKNPVEPEKTGGDPELAWRVLGLLNLYRLGVPSLLLVLSLLASRPPLLGAAFPAPYYFILAAWFATGVICIGLLKTRWPSLQAQAFIHIAFDVVAVTALLVTSAGAASGAGLLLIMPIAAVSLLLPSRTATTIAAIAALFVLFQQIALWWSGLADASDLTQAGMLGGVIFFAALAVTASGIERLAIEIRHLQRTELREAEEYFAPGQKGSSAMPHKRNPILSENLTGLARLVRGAVVLRRSEQAGVVTKAQALHQRPEQCLDESGLAYSSPGRGAIGSKRTRTRAGSNVTKLPFSKASTS